MFVEGTVKKAGLLIILAILSLLMGYFWLTLVILFGLVFLIQFFRDPQRETPMDKDLIVAAADGRFLKGKIDLIEEVSFEDPLMKYILDPDEKGIRISTFMSPFDVHVNRVPVSGRIIKTKYYPGDFKIAWGDVVTRNEKNLIVIDSDNGKVGVIQIAGYVARRIVQYVKIGDQVQVGERLGMIKFGSRVDIIIPQNKYHLMVEVGDRSIAGETLIARKST